MEIHDALVTSADFEQAETALKATPMLRFDLQLFGDGDGGDGGSDDGDSGDGGDGGDAGDDAGGDKGAKNDKGEKVYSEAHVRKIHAENANRRKENEDLRKRLDELEKKDLDAQTDAKKRAEDERARADRIESESKEKLTAADRRYILSEAKRLAKDAGIIDVDDVKTAIDLADLRISDDDVITGLEDKIAALKESKPHWFKGAKKDDDADDKGKKKAGAPPKHKEGGDSGGVDWSKKTEAEFQEYLRSKGVNA